MIIFTLFAAFFVVFILWRPARLPVTIAAATLFWLLAAGWLTAPLLDQVQLGTPDTSAPRFGERTVIVLLGGGTEYDSNDVLVPKADARWRIVKTATVYAACRQAARRCEVIVSGGNPQHHRATEADTYAPYLLREHVERDDLRLENKSYNTYENAANVAGMLRHEHYDSLILITSKYHLHRSLLDFARFGLAPQPVSSNTRRAQVGLTPRWTNLIGANIALHELFGLAQFHLYRALGWF
ncbi:YdcF family protein [Trinickia fusca]|uniref:YdcF family protein n=1 Tax=Trinickia fusca TaxID=2419777 RepID=UPI001FEA37CF|nr:YdcF family protein [Trinickia fusca]